MFISGNAILCKWSICYDAVSGSVEKYIKHELRWALDETFKILATSWFFISLLYPCFSVMVGDVAEE